MNTTNLDSEWARWIMDYREKRPPSGPIGWYDLDDLRAAFLAGARADFDHELREVADKIIKNLRP